ncbi:hypothetical protein [Streptomyces sp. NPDC058579]|uniref:hypothetical protein n=1 Tax=Streptomyces sp. NPDC058579 TaxID=3346548 RepID=UPI0036507E21
MDNNEQRHGTAGGAPAAIALPAVAWQAAGEEPATATGPASPPLPVPAPAPAPEPSASEAAHPDPEPDAEANPEPEPATAPVAGAVAAVPEATLSGQPDQAAEPSAASEETAQEAAQEAAADTLAAAAVAAPATPSPPRPTRRISKPMIAAAATSGVVLMGLPLLLSQLGGDSTPSRVPPRPTGFNQPDGAPDGFVPGADAPDKGSLLPGVAAPGAAAAPTKGTSNSNTPVTNTGTGTGKGGSPSGSPAAGPRNAPATGQGSGPAGSPTTAPGQNKQQPASDPRTTAPSAPPKKEYTAVAGPGCTGAGTGFSRRGWYTDGKEGWKQFGTGGYGSSGCNGDFFAMPMSGHNGSDAKNSMLWTFRTGAVTTGTCQVSVHIPNNSDIKAVGGKPSYYTVHAGDSGSSPFLGSFTVNQPSQLGRWVGAGTFRITGGRLAVKLHDRGQDWSGSTKTYAHHGGDAVRVQCTSS